MFRPISRYPVCGTLLDGKDLYLQGGMAYVYRSWSREYGDVAVKIPRPHADLRRWEVEWKIWSQFGPREDIVRFYESGVEEGLEYIVMEYVPFPDLSRVRSAQPEGRLDPRLSAQVAARVCRALDYAYRQGGIRAHRDVKPSNVFAQIDDGRVGAVKLSDFGIVKLNAGVTIDREILGCAWYSSPEQLDYGKQVDQRSDVYSLGITLYELVTGRLPFDGSRDQVSRAHKHEAPRPPSQYNPALPRELEAIIRRCLEKDPNSRYQTIMELAGVLEALAGPPVPGRGEGPEPPREPRPPEQGPPVWGVLCLAFGAMLLLAGALGVVAALWGLRSEPDARTWVWVGAGGSLVLGMALLITGAVGVASTGLPVPAPTPSEPPWAAAPLQAPPVEPPVVLPEARLVAVSGPLSGSRFPVDKPQVAFGRNFGLDIQLPMDDPFASRNHGFIVQENGAFVVVDTSRNGIYVNDERVDDRRALAHGDRIQTGVTQFYFELPGA
ncbi:MAG: FHA domain-containing protein [Planctomycetes bacterium]|nr:FHA domain-containing protein [Planctomycetota bacterium]